MSKTNFFVKYLKNINNFINNLLEENLNKLNFKNFSFLLKNNKIILTFVALFVVFISYLLLPTFYKQNDIAKFIKKDLQSKFDLDFKFSHKINYNFFPRPHFRIVNASISDGKNEISKIEDLKIFISFHNLFSIKNIKLKNVILKNANFDLNSKNYNFFLDLFNKDFQNGKMIIKDSNVFFRNIDGDVLFINKIFYMKYYYELKELKNIFYSENEIFNIPFSIESFFEEENNKIFSLLNFKLMKLKIENELKIQNDKKTGKSQFISNTFKRILEYQIEKNSFNFHLFDKLDQPDVTYKGNFNFKPFYGYIEGDLDEINFNYLFGSYAVISQLLKTEIFNNKNINFKLNINANRVYNNSNFENIYLNSKIQDGLIDTDNTKFKWKDAADFELLESLIFVRDGELVLDGKLNINIKNYNKIYKFLLTPKKYRNQIKQVNFNFTYNFDQKIAELKDFKIDNKINQNASKILNNIILKKDDLQNRIYLKNLFNDAIKAYAG